MTKCNRNILRLSISIFSFQGPPGPPGAIGPSGPAGKDVSIHRSNRNIVKFNLNDKPCILHATIEKS